MTKVADEVREKLIGAWRLVSFEIRSAERDHVSYPYGEDAQGTIMYSPDGFVSVQFTRSGREHIPQGDPHSGEVGDLGTAAGYFFYSGSFSVTEDGTTVTHHIAISLLPSWVGQVHNRLARLEGSRLELSLPEPEIFQGELSNAHLIWERASR